jgi:bifunctional UDP-N-acetylglucosamine pyrophosphorylase / glucosamine-1-phosphate N-acetyltransferase
MPKNQRAAKSSTKPSQQPRFAIAIMAAGKGTRLKSKHPKVLHAVGGKPLLAHVIRAAAKVVPASDIFSIIGHEADKVREAVASYGTNFVEQKEQRGTGHAVMQCREALRGYDHVLVLSGDVPLIKTETIASVREFHLAQNAAMTILTAIPPDPFGYGRIIRKKKSGKATTEVAEIVEQKSASVSQQKIREVNSGIYAFSVPELFARIDRLSTNNAHHEFYLTDIAGLLTHDKKKVVGIPASDFNEVIGVNTRLELAALDALLREEKARELMASGVTIFRPETCVLDADVKVGPDTVIEPFVQLLGSTSIGGDCVVRSYSVVKDSRIGDAVTIRNGCVIDESTVDNGAIIGPFSHLRPASQIGENAHVGNFVETKKTRLGRSSKANHLTYLGDAEIGEGVNIGAGTITCNYDGVNKHKTVIDDGAFVGSDSTLVAPVKVGRGAYVGAASCITEDVPEDALAVGRGRQVNKEGWAKAKREERKSQAATRKS